MTDNTVTISFQWTEYKPDKRQYKQQSISLLPTLGNGPDGFPVNPEIEIKLPVKHEFVANSEEIITAQLEGKQTPYPILKPAGMKFCMDQFEVILSDPEEVKPDDFKPDVEEDWGDPEKAETEKSPDDDWSEASEKTADEPWDEDKEDWGEEK